MNGYRIVGRPKCGAAGNQQIALSPSGITTNVWNYENQMTLVQMPSGSRVSPRRATMRDERDRDISDPISSGTDLAQPPDQRDPANVTWLRRLITPLASKPKGCNSHPTAASTLRELTLRLVLASQNGNLPG